MKHKITELTIGLSIAEWRCIRDAARDAHMDLREYVRIMALAAAGMEGILKHLESAIAASVVAADHGQAMRATKAKRGRR